MIPLLLKRRLWIIKNRLYSTFGLLFLLPVFLHIVINLSFKRMVVNPLWNVSHEQWIFPGLVIIVVMVMMIPIVLRDLFELRIRNKLLPSLTIAPVTSITFIYNFFTAVLIETAIYSIITIGIFSTIMMPTYGLVEYLIMFPFIILFLGIGINILITLALIIDKTTLFNVMVLTFFMFIVFGSGLIVSFEYFPQIVGNILRYLPTGQIMQALRMAMFSFTFNWIIILIAIVTIAAWSYLNGFILEKRLYR